MHRTPETWKGDSIMQFSTPLYRLKRQARQTARASGIPLHKALDDSAKALGFQGWSHLSAESARHSPAISILSRVRAGELVLIAGRPGHGKTLLGLDMVALAAQFGRRGHFFSLDYTDRDVTDGLRDLGHRHFADTDAPVIDTSDAICADHVVTRLSSADGPVLAVIDYLQLLDQRRTNPPLDSQLDRLQCFARDTGAVIALLSQVDRRFDDAGKGRPDRADIRLPNPADLDRFSRFCFLHDGQLHMEPV